MGKRRTRWVIIRNTYTQLEDTTIKTWHEWFKPEAFGWVNTNKMELIVQSGDIHAEFLFRALDRPDHVANVLSLEVTGAWINEAREIPRTIIEAVDDRCGRFPPKREGGCTWRGIIMDTNPPDEDHWWYNMAETDRPQGWDYYAQPGGMIELPPVDGKPVFVVNPDAENLDNLEDDFYEQRAQGKAPDHIRVYYCGKYGFVKEGRPVIPEYSDQLHCASEKINPNPKVPIVMGFDFGLTPAAVFMQRFANGRWIWFREVCTEDMGITTFAEHLVNIIRSDYRGHNFLDRAWGDPAGSQKSAIDRTTPFQIMNKIFKEAAMDIKVRPAPSQDPVLRREAMTHLMYRVAPEDRKHKFMISPDMVTVRKGLNGAYCYRRLRVSGEHYEDKPSKNKYSHPIEAGQYAMLGGGEGVSLVRISKKRRQRQDPAFANYFGGDRPDGNQTWMGN